MESHFNEYSQQTRQPTLEQQKTEIDLVEVFYIFWGHLWQILLCLVTGAAIAFSVTYFLITPQYQATARIYIVSASNNSVVNLSDLQVGSQLTADYQELLISRPLLQDVINNLGLSIDYKNLERQISITNTNDTRILKIVVTDVDPQRAADIANELVNQASIYLPQIMETEAPNLVESAVPPTTKSSPSYSRNTMLGSLLGLVLACGVLLVRYLMNDTFVTPDDISKYFGIQPLATIPEGNLGSFNKERKKNKKEKGGKHENAGNPRNAAASF